MSVNPMEGGAIPAWSLGWRLQRSMAHAGMTAGDISEALDISRRTVGRWINDEAAPKRAFLIQWAFVTGTNLEWLETGNAPQPSGPGGVNEECTRRDSNPKPSDP